MSAVPAGAESFRDATGRVRPGWRTSLASLICLGFSPSVLQVMSLGVFTPYLREEFGWGVRQISVAATILAIMAMIVAPLQGLLVDRYGARRLILVSIPLFGFGYAALSLLPDNLLVLYLFWGLLPVLGIGLWPGSYVKATSSWFDRRLGLAIGLATAGIGIGAALFPMQIHWLASTHGWRSAFAVIGIASVVIGWPVAILYIRDQDKAAGTGNADADRPAGDESALPATFWLLFAAFLLLGVFSTAILFHLVSILTGNGMTRQLAVGAQATLGLMMIVGRLGSGLLIDRIPVRIVLPAFVALAVAGLAMLSVGVTGLAALLAGALAGLLIGAEIDVLGFVVKRYFGLRRYGTLYGILFSVFQLGGAVGVYALAALREASGDYDAGLQLLAAACILAGALFTLIGPYRYGAKPAPAARGGAAVPSAAG